MAAHFLAAYVPINQILQYFIIYPADAPTDTAVIFLHGGPGESSAPFLYLTQPEKRSYHFVYYDQRGTGKTQQKNKHQAEEVTLEALTEDLYETVRYVKKQCQVKQIILFGHSWGTVLGITYLEKYSNTVTAYIGMGQVVSFLKGERMAYEHCLSLVKETGNTKDLKKLEALQNYPGNMMSVQTLAAFRRIQMKYHLAGMEGGMLKMLALMRKSPVFSWRDVGCLLSSVKINRHLMDTVFTYDCSSKTDFSIPMYFICGRQDWQVPSAAAYAYYQKINAPDKALYWIENAGHSTDMDNPQAFHEAIEKIVWRIKKIA